MIRQPESSGTPWVSTEVPCFAVVGKVNMGKSAVLATLLEEDDDRIIRISPEPGETTRCQRLSLVLDGTERLRFIDTPGFQQPVEALRAIRRLHDKDVNLSGVEVLSRFVERYAASGEFGDECRLLAPILDGAGILYVIDPGIPVQDSFVAEIEILRLSGRTRLAVLNRRQGDNGTPPAHEAAWRAHLGQGFNLVRSFDAHQARFAARRDLLAALNQIDERDRTHLETTMALLDAEWSQRRERAAERILTFLRAGLMLRETARFADSSGDSAKARRVAIDEATERYYERLSELERAASDDLLEIYRHTAIRAEAARRLSGELDLASGETWRRFGLTRGQLTWLGATVGAGAGFGVDAMALGHTLGLGTLIGGMSGGALAFFKGESLPTLAVSFGPLGAFGGRQLTLGPPRNPNFAWVLLDSLLMRYRRLLGRAHARRGDGVLASTDPDDDAGIARRLPRVRQKALGRWLRDISRERLGAEHEVAALDALLDTLAEIEQRG